MSYIDSKIISIQAEKILLQLFNISGEASALPGEIDFNFKIRIDNKDRFILKISRPDEEYNYLDFQQKLLQYLELP